MKNMNAKTKKWLAVTGGLAVCAVLVALIGQQFQTEKPIDAPLPSQSQAVSDVTVDNGSTEKEIIVQKPDITKPETTDNGAVSTGTEQTIQGDVTKPQEPQPPKTEDGKDKTPPKTNNGKDHEFTPESPDAPPTYEKDETEKKPAESKPSGGSTNDKGQTYLPGFGWIDYSGENQGSVGDSDGDINKPVGNMD